MKKLKMYSYTFLLIFSMIVVCPLIFRQIWKTSKAENPSSSNKEIPQSDSSDPALIADTSVSVSDSTITTVPIATEAISTEPPVQFEPSGASYFDDALFIGDSRTVGISEYGTLKNSDYFCDTGMSVYNLDKSNCNISGIGNVTLERLLDNKQYGKIYIMLGLNEIGYEMSQTIEKYHGWVNYLHEKQPDAIVYIQGNLHVTAAKSSSHAYINNSNINTLNNAIKTFADGDHIFYIDPNEFFDDETGSLRIDYTNDGVHLTGSHYMEWCEWLCSKTIITESMRNSADSTEASSENATSAATS